MMLVVSTAYSQTILDKSDQSLKPEDVTAMTRAVLGALNSQAAYFYALSYKTAEGEGEDRNVICGIVGHGGEYAFYYDVSENEAVLLPKQMGSRGEDILVQQLAEVGCPPSK
jgi:hypothetical protein